MHRYTLVATLLIAFAGLVTLLAPTDPDVWWHLRNGRLILESGLPRSDVYSFTAAGRPWILQEWLTEVAMHKLQSSAGYGALSLLFGLFQALGAVVVYALLRQSGAGRSLTLAFLALYLVLASPSWGVRPQVLIPLFLGTFYLILRNHKARPSRHPLLWALPPLMVLWANVHASFITGVFLAGAFLVGEAVNNYLYRPREGVPLRPLALTLAGCLVATLLNPYFVELWTYPLSYLLSGTGNPLLRYITEWHSPNFRELTNILFAASLVLMAVVGLSEVASREQDSTDVPARFGLRRRIDTTGALVLATFTLLALQAVRMVPVYAVIALPLLAAGLVRLWPRLSSDADVAPGVAESRLSLLSGFAALAAIAYLTLTAPTSQTGHEPRTDTKHVYPAQAVARIGQLGSDVRLYNDFGWGGYLIYNLYPQHKVFIDGRADMYREGIFEDYMTVQNVAPGWREILQRHGVNTVLVTRGSSFDYALKHEPGWHLFYSDGVSVVYRALDQ